MIISPTNILNYWPETSRFKRLNICFNERKIKYRKTVLFSRVFNRRWLFVVTPEFNQPIPQQKYENKNFGADTLEIVGGEVAVNGSWPWQIFMEESFQELLSTWK